MINKSTLQAISDQDMDRKTFLKYSGLALLSLVGLKTVVSLLAPPSDQKLIAQQPQKEVARGFGSGRYGA